MGSEQRIHTDLYDKVKRFYFKEKDKIPKTNQKKFDSVFSRLDDLLGDIGKNDISLPSRDKNIMYLCFDFEDEPTPEQIISYKTVLFNSGVINLQCIFDNKKYKKTDLFRKKTMVNNYSFDNLPKKRKMNKKITAESC